MAITIGRINIDGGQQTPGWTPWRYERAVRKVIQEIGSTASGAIVIAALRERTLIIPYPPNLPRNADADVARPRTTARYRDGYRANDFIYSCGDGAPMRNFGFGTGRGIEVEIRYTPGHWIPGAVQYGGATGPGGSADEVLLHELLHAVRITLGLGDCRQTVAPLHRYDNRSEFYAVLVENVYSSETRRPPRRDHHGFVALRDPVQYYAQPSNKLMIMNFCRSMPQFTRDLASVPCNFNPFREYYREMMGLDPSSVRRWA